MVDVATGFPSETMRRFDAERHTPAAKPRRRERSTPGTVKRRAPARAVVAELRDPADLPHSEDKPPPRLRIGDGFRAVAALATRLARLIGQTARSSTKISAAASGSMSLALMNVTTVRSVRPSTASTRLGRIVS